MRVFVQHDASVNHTHWQRSRTALDGVEDLAGLAWRLRDHLPSVLFDSAREGTRARWSFLVVGAREVLRWTVGDTLDPFDRLRELLDAEGADRDDVLPFGGGLVGWIGYEARQVIEELPGRPAPPGELPDVWFAEAHLFLARDHQLAQTWLVRLHGGGSAAENQRLDRLERIVRDAAMAGETSRPGCESLAVEEPDPERHLDGVRRIRELITEGDVYQVNLGQAFRAAKPADPHALYLALRACNPPTHGVCAVLPDGGAMLSVSPESFLTLDGREVSTRPIKGTIARGADAVSDAAARDELARSGKDRAELAMIVDVLRNDLSRVAVPGSVRVDAPLEIETHPTVHHLVAEVRATLEDGADRVDLLRATFPGGSITGAPRIRAMEVIEDLENFRRGCWCGSFLHLGYEGGLDSNILIRTLFTRGDEVVFPGGGGITIRSDPESEHRECLDKVAGIRRALEEGHAS